MGPMKNADAADPGVSAAVAVRMEELTAWIVEGVAKMLREHRSTIGNRLIETCLDVTMLLCEAAYTRCGSSPGRTPC